MYLWANVGAGSSGGISECENLFSTNHCQVGGKHQVSSTLGRVRGGGGDGDELSGDGIL